MSNQGQPNQPAIKAFAKEGSSSSAGDMVPLGLLIIGAGSMAVAVATALAPKSVPLVGKLTLLLDRVGLDKGPLLMFGVLSTAMGFALTRMGASSKDSGAAQTAAELAQANASGIEFQGEILGSVQAELGQIREEVAAARREAQEAKRSDDESQGQANDPLFRLAASLDQLGAHIDKRVDKARREQVEAITGLSKTVEVSAQQRESSFEHTAKELEALRMDVADMRAQLARVVSEVSATKEAVASAGSLVQPESASSNGSTALAPTAAALPRELSDEAPEPAAPIPSVPAEEAAQEVAPGEAPAELAPAEPAYEGYSHEEEPKPTNTMPDPAKLGVSMESLGFQEPPAPMPAAKPSEGLDLIDDMDEDTAREADQTPPLFPDM